MSQQQETVADKRIETERWLIACAMGDPDGTRQTAGWLAPELMMNEQDAEFWRQFVAGDELGIIFRRMGTQYWFEAGGWVENMPFIRPEPQELAGEIAQCAHMAGANLQVAQLTQALADGDYDTYREALQELAARPIQTQGAVRTAIDVSAHFLEVLRTPNRILPTFIPSVDRMIGGGLERQTLAILAARPSMGKSCLAMQIARNTAASGKKAAFFSLEMSEVNLWARIACPLIGKTWAQVKGGQLTPAEEARLQVESANAADSLGRELIIQDGTATTDTIWALAARERPDLVIVDHIRLLADDRGDNENHRLGRITWRLKEMAKRLDCAVMALAQLNRKVEARMGNVPELSDLRDSGEIEENADLVLMPYWEGYYKPELDKGKTRTASELWVRKARDGEINCVVKLIFDKAQQWFEAEAGKG